MEAIRVAVIGAGNMGKHHARVLSSLPGVELVQVVDIDLHRAAEVASLFGVRYASAPDVAGIDAAIVAVPTSKHYCVAKRLISDGVSVLIEKPISSTPMEARGLIAAAKAKNTVLAVGHIERFNPAVRSLRALIDNPIFIQIERLSPYTPRINESVVFDLMVHDLDLLYFLTGIPPLVISAAGLKVMSGTPDVASALFRLGPDCIASISVSRVTQDKIRRISVSEKDRFLAVDCLRQDISIRKEIQSSFLNGDGYIQSSLVETPRPPKGEEPLVAELKDFINAVRNGLLPEVTGEDGLAVVKLAEEVERCMR
jgi:predicted dehydrogenase